MIGNRNMFVVNLLQINKTHMKGMDINRQSCGFLRYVYLYAGRLRSFLLKFIHFFVENLFKKHLIIILAQ